MLLIFSNSTSAVGHANIESLLSSDLLTAITHKTKSPAVTHKPFWFSAMTTEVHARTDLRSLFPFLLQANEDSQESLTSFPRRDTMGSFLPDSSSYELLAVIGK